MNKSANQKTSDLYMKQLVVNTSKESNTNREEMFKPRSKYDTLLKN